MKIMKCPRLAPLNKVKLHHCAMPACNQFFEKKQNLTHSYLNTDIFDSVYIRESSNRMEFNTHVKTKYIYNTIF